MHHHACFLFFCNNLKKICKIKKVPFFSSMFSDLIDKQLMQVHGKRCVLPILLVQDRSFRFLQSQFCSQNNLFVSKTICVLKKTIVLVPKPFVGSKTDILVSTQFFALIRRTFYNRACSEFTHRTARCPFQFSLLQILLRIFLQLKKITDQWPACCTMYIQAD